MKFNIIKTIFTAAAIAAAASCNDGPDRPLALCEDIPVIVDVPYVISSPSVITPTRAMTSDEQALYDLRVFIFREDGTLKGYTHVTDGLVQNGSKSTVQVSTTTGESIICAVANSSTTIWSVQETDWEHVTLDGLKSLTFSASVEGVTNPTDGRFLMSGWMNGGASVTIGTQGLETSGEVCLRRVLSHVTVNFLAGTDAKGNAVKKLSLKKYEIHGIPMGGMLFPDGKSTSGDFQDIPYSQLSTQTPNQIVGYFPENLQSAPMSASINSQKDRERNTYSADGVKSFPNAPDNSMYVVATVELETTDFVGEVQYTIHLGDFGGSLNDFNIVRNCRYTYNVRVNDANDFVSDVTKDDDGRTEGVVFDKNSRNVYTVDSHYGVVLAQFTAGEIRKAMEASRATGMGYGLMFQINTWRGGTGECVIDASGNIYREGENIGTVAEAEKSLKISGVDHFWLKFVEASSNSIYDASDSFDGGTPDQWANYVVTQYWTTTYYHLDKTVYSFPSFLQQLCKWAESASDTDTRTFDCYVRENYYYEPGVTWAMFVNRDPRTAYILSNVQTSIDGMSMYGALSFGVTQYSIQTAYATDKAGQIIAVGLESIDETAGKYPTDYVTMPLTGSNAGRDARVKFTEQTTGSSGYDSGGSFKLWNGYTYWDTVEDERTAIYGGGSTSINPVKACGIRNMEFYAPGENTTPHKNESSEWMGYAAPWEMGWFLPSLEQYTAFWIGEEALSKDARLYQKQTSAMGSYSSDSFTADKIAGMMHYWTYTSGKEIFWAEEGAAFGAYSGKGDGRFVRCARLLQSYGVADENGIGNSQGSHGWGLDKNLMPAPYYTYASSTKIVDLENLDKSALRTVYQENELPLHNEREEANKPAERFQVADAFVGRTGIVERPDKSNFWTTSTTNKDIVEKKVTCQGTYSQDGDAVGWRVPNQRELAIQSLLLASGSLEFPYPDTGVEYGYFSLTAYSNPSYRACYGIQQSNLRMYDPFTGGKTYPGWIRCVRDVRQ